MAKAMHISTDQFGVEKFLQIGKRGTSQKRTIGDAARERKGNILNM